MDSNLTMWTVTRRKILDRDGHKCTKCGAKEQLHVHHIKPVIDGGTDAHDNLKTLCAHCHKGEEPKKLRYPFGRFSNVTQVAKSYRHTKTLSSELSEFMVADMNLGIGDYLIWNREVDSDGEPYWTVIKGTDIVKERFAPFFKEEKKVEDAYTQ